jgi:hypothetical protein
MANFTTFVVSHALEALSRAAGILKNQLMSTQWLVNKNWHTGCRQSFQRRGPQQKAQPQNKKRRKQMYGLMNLPKLGAIGGVGLVSLAIYGVSVAFYVLATGIFGGSVA